MKRTDRKTARQRRNAGFTLVEILVAVVISAIVMVGTMVAFVAVKEISFEADVVNDVTKEGRIFSDTVVRDLRMAAGVEEAFDSFITSDNEVILKIPSVNSAGEILDVIAATDEVILQTFDRVIYYHTSMNGRSTVVREIIPDPQSAREAKSEIFGNFVTDDRYLGAFSPVQSATDAAVLHFQLKDADTFFGRTHEMPISGSVRLRNKI